MRKYDRVKKMKKRYVFGSISLLILVITTIPILVNYLMNFNIGVNVNKGNEWIGFHASYLGAIVGGIISGGLTLGGVFLTIKNQQKIEKQNNFPKVRLNIDFVEEKMQALNFIEGLLAKGEYKYAISHGLEILKYKEEILQRSAFVNVIFYKITRDILKELEMLVILESFVEHETDNLGQRIRSYKSLDKYDTTIKKISNNLSVGKEYLKKESDHVIDYYSDSII